MSSEEDLTGHSTNTKAWKKRRLQGACDVCRRKKIRCDSAQMPGKRCSSCVAFNLNCTHDEPVKKRGPKSRYVEQLESRVQSLEEALRAYQAADTQPPAASQLRLPSETPISFGTASSSKSSPPSDLVSDSSDEDDLAHIALSEHMKKLEVNAIDTRFFGLSSGFQLIKNAINVKNEYTGNPRQTHFKRPAYWRLHPWERASEAREAPRYDFPDADLMESLMTLYFTHININLPILHQPTFRRSVAEGLHLRDQRFAATLLLVCAVGSRYSNDPRVIVDGSGSELSCGWKWFDQVHILRKSLFDAPASYELQFYCLGTIFVHGTSSPQASWTLVGLGIRFAQELGIHRRKPEGYRPTVEDELKKRAFWVLLFLDRLISSFLGRPSAIRDEDYDVEPIVECDDEYWEIDADSVVTYRQPPGKPSLLAFHNAQAQLCEILAFAVRTLYATKKSKLLLGLVGDRWEQRTVAELDSALNNWIDSVPSHLRWDPTMENLTFFNQSVLLYTLYYNIQMQVHRPFIHKPSFLTFSSHAICANAARSCSHVLDAHFRRGQVITLPHTMMAAFTAGVVLLMNIWGKRPGVSIDLRKELADVKKCMNALRSTDHRWTISGRLWDMLQELSYVQDMPLPEGYVQNKKRLRNTDTTDSLDGPSMTSNFRMSSDTFAQVVSSTAQPFPTQTPDSWSMDDTALPMYSSELGRLPIHPGDVHSTVIPQQGNLLHPSPVHGYTKEGPPLIDGDPQLNTFLENSMHGGQRAFDTVITFDVDPGSGPFTVDYVDTQNSHRASNDLLRAPLPESVDIWSSAPAGFSFEEWGAYIAGMGGQDLFVTSVPGSKHGAYSYLQ